MDFRSRAPSCDRRSTPEQGEIDTAVVDAACLSMQRASKPVIDLVEGACLGGCRHALACAFMLAVERAR